MKKLIILLFALGTLNANNEFDIQKLGKAVEILYIRYDKEILNLKTQLKAQNQRILQLEQEIKKLKKEEVKKTVKKDTNIKRVNIKSGLESYLYPYNSSTHIKSYKFNEILKIEYCNARLWCKLEDADEYVKQYLLR